ncbi:hypothetical protein EB093_00890 [bacterium]|nr:hypothetical protein [bacterium]
MWTGYRTRNKKGHVIRSTVMRALGSCVICLLILTVTTQSVERIVSLSPAATEILATLNAESQLVGVSDDSDFPLSISSLPKIGPFLSPNIAKIAAVRPTMVIGIGQHETTPLRELRRRGVKVVLFESPDSIPEIYRIIRQIGILTGHEKQSGIVLNRLYNEVASIAHTRTKIKPTVFVVIWHPPIVSATDNTFIGDMIRCAGGVNAIDPGAVRYPKVPRELMLYKNPSVIIVANPSIAESVTTDAVFQVTAAYRSHHIISSIDPNLLMRPGPRFPQAIRAIQRAISTSVPR